MRLPRAQRVRCDCPKGKRFCQMNRGRAAASTETPAGPSWKRQEDAETGACYPDVAPFAVSRLERDRP
jgi:hypothetical protein